MKRALLGYLLVVVVVFGAALFPQNGMMIFGDDIHHQYYFLREFFNNFLRFGIFPWWNPYIFGGQPFIADPMVNIWYPPTWLFVLLPLHIAYSWHIAFHILLAMLGMRVLTKSWISGLIFGLSGFFMARMWGGHVDVIAAASWMPWVVWACTKQKNIVIASVLFALQLYSGYQTMAFFTVMIVGFMGLVTRKLWQSITPLFLGLGLAALQIVPEQEFFRASLRTYPLPYSWVSYGSYTLKSLWQFINPFYFGNQLTYQGPPPNFIEHSAFIGIIGLVLALIGATRKNIFLPIVVVGLWISLGSNAPIDLQYILWKIIPMYHYLRIPPRHLILVVFGLAGLAGIGFSRLPRSPRYLRLLIGGIIVLEMVLFARSFVELRPVPEKREDKELIALLKQDAEPHRVLQNFGVWLKEREAMEFDAVMAHNIFSATGYDTSILRPYYEYVAMASGQKGSDAILQHDVQVPYLSASAGNAIDFLNIKYIMVPKSNDPFIGYDRYRLIRDTQSRVYENTTVKPRLYFKNACGTAVVLSYTPNKIVIVTDSVCNDLLLSSENWYPGWGATIDGKKANITKTNNTFRTLFVSSGNHTVVYEYHPTIFVFGGGISVLTSIVLFWMVCKKRKP